MQCHVLGAPKAIFYLRRTIAIRASRKQKWGARITFTYSLLVTSMHENPWVGTYTVVWKLKIKDWGKQKREKCLGIEIVQG